MKATTQIVQRGRKNDYGDVLNVGNKKFEYKMFREKMYQGLNVQG